MKGRRFKRRFKRRSNKKKVSNFKKGNFSSITIPKLSRHLQLPISNRVRTVLTINFIGYLAAGALNEGGYGYTPIYYSYPFTPFTSSGLTIAGNSVTTVANLNPAGLLSFMNGTDTGLYSRGKVFASSIRAIVTPQVVADTCSVCIVPYRTNSSQRFASLETAASAPLASNIRQCSYIGDTRANMIKHYCTSSQLFGVKPDAINAGTEYSFTYTQAPAQDINWAIVYQVNNATANDNLINVSVEVKYYIEFSEQTQPGLPDIYASPNEPGATGNTEI